MPALVSLAITFLVNTLIAVLLTAISYGQGFSLNLLFSQCIGLSIWAFTTLAVRVTQPGLFRLFATIVAIVVSSVLGYFLSLFLSGLESSGNRNDAILLGLVFGGVVSTIFYLRERNIVLQSEIRQRQMQQMEAEKRRVEAQLKMLQAQIEPHFLFNTLSNVNVLIDSDPSLAAQLLDALIRYLRASLARTREENACLSDEIALLKAYLEILKIRMGDRLTYFFEIAPAILEHPFPPMLLQPLVENAITHGIEPKREGGTVRIAGRQEGERLMLFVIDDGVGCKTTGRQGVGLSNIRMRLETLYAGAASLKMSENENGGMSAKIEIPA